MAAEAIFAAPVIDDDDRAALARLEDSRRHLADQLRQPRRWTGLLRRNAQARAVKGSNSIEGYIVSDQDAVAAINDEPPVEADERVWKEIEGYRDVLTFVLQQAATHDLGVDESKLKSMHFMLLRHDLAKGPGQYRTGPICVADDRGRTTYTAPAAEIVPTLMATLIASLEPGSASSSVIDAAMAHLNLVMIHPFRDGNGRMARALQTMVLARDHIIEPIFSSIEEWLGHNTDDYYRVLAVTGGGAWNPGKNTTLWLKFSVRAHVMQASTHVRRFDETNQVFTDLTQALTTAGLPERMTDALYETSLGFTLTRGWYVDHIHVGPRTATRDLATLVEEGFLDAFGATKERTYAAGERVRTIMERIRAQREPLDDPYPWLPGELLIRAGAADIARTTGAPVPPGTAAVT